MYPLLATLFFTTLLLVIILLVLFLFPNFKKWRAVFFKGTMTWLFIYLAFITFGTGPQNLHKYPRAEISPYKLPWAQGDRRFVAQGHRSFTSHRGLHHYAWDFVMPEGTPILAARTGRVLRAVQHFQGIGRNSNYIVIEHSDGQRSLYAHIRFKGALVQAGDWVRQGQPIARSGMVGQTVFPHLHFCVLNSAETTSLPITFQDVEDGVPLAGHFYSSQNTFLKPHPKLTYAAPHKD